MTQGPKLRRTTKGTEYRYLLTLLLVYLKFSIVARGSISTLVSSRSKYRLFKFRETDKNRTQKLNVCSILILAINKQLQIYPGLEEVKRAFRREKDTPSRFLAPSGNLLQL